jgi:hypothetical protein
MGKRAAWLVAGAVAFLITCLHFGLAGQYMPKSCSGPMLCQIQENSPSSYICMDYSHRDRPLQYWIRISESGDAWYVRYDNLNRVERDGIGYAKVLESKSGKLSSTEVQTLFELIDRKGFFQLKGSYSGEGTGVLSEDDILKVYLSLDEKTKVVYARPPSFIPEQLTDIVEAVKEKIPGLQEDGKCGVFLKAEALSELRAKSLREQFKLMAFSERKLKDHNYLKKAIENPGQFIHAGSWKNEEIDRYVNKYNFFFVSTLDGEFKIDIYLRERP